MKAKKKRILFICQITEDNLKVIKCLSSEGIKIEILNLENEKMPSDIDDKKLSERLNQIFKKLGYDNNPVSISLPCSYATCRYLKVPTQIPEEIEKIIYLQAPRYIPYQAEELITGYQSISSDKEGYSYINLAIVHKSIIERHLNIFRELKPSEISIVLSSYGLCNFYYHDRADDAETVMVIDVDLGQAEIAIISRRKLLFSRCFRINKTQPNWKDFLIDEINKTQGVYLKEISNEAPSKIVILGINKTSQELVEGLNKKTGLSIENLSYNKKIAFPENLLNSIQDSNNSFVSLIGVGLVQTEGSLNLLPQNMKEELRRLPLVKKHIQMILFLVGIFLISGMGMVKSLDNKAIYLKQLKSELNKIEKEAKPLGELEKRLQLLENRLEKKPSSLEVLYELHKIMPEQISLLNLNYEEDNQVILRGQTTELNSVLEFVSNLEKSQVFKNFNAKVRYATKKSTQTGEIVDFEIGCLREK